MEGGANEVRYKIAEFLLKRMHEDKLLTEEEWEKILDGTTDKILDYVYCVIGPYELENAPSKTVAALLDMPSLWGDLKKYEEQGEAKKVKGIAEALKIMYQTLKDVGYGEENQGIQG